uniref:DUF4860 domain-containing protein n=1 Tax=Acetatifactor sp. TaxID=1872090 RepID=UPI0040572637
MNMISTNQEKRFIVDILFVLALFGLFTLSALMLVTIGSEVYRHTVDDMGNNYETRTAVAYITEKIRQNDYITTETSDSDYDNISISNLDGKQALMLSQTFNDEVYCTYLYLHEGYLKELFMKSDSYLGDNAAAAGQNICELSSFSMEQVSDNLLSLQITTPTGESHKIFVSTHCTPQN